MRSMPSRTTAMPSSGAPISAIAHPWRTSAAASCVGMDSSVHAARARSACRRASARPRRSPWSPPPRCSPPAPAIRRPPPPAPPPLGPLAALVRERPRLVDQTELPGRQGDEAERRGSRVHRDDDRRRLVVEGERAVTVSPSARKIPLVETLLLLLEVGPHLRG